MVLRDGKFKRLMLHLVRPIRMHHSLVEGHASTCRREKIKPLSSFTSEPYSCDNCPSSSESAVVSSWISNPNDLITIQLLPIILFQHESWRRHSKYSRLPSFIISCKFPMPHNSRFSLRLLKMLSCFKYGDSQASGHAFVNFRSE